MRIIYLSPHLDDAVLSAGGLIRAETAAGSAVEIWTFMAGVPDDPSLPEFAQMMHRIWGFRDAIEAVRVRRAEDIRAAALVGAKPVHFDFLDCIYRRGKNGQALYGDITLPIQPDDADLPAQIAQTMIAWLKPEDTVICQLGIGAHVDHVIVRRAAEMLHRPLVYIADVPYLLDHPGDLPTSTSGMRAVLQPISEPDFRSWLTAIECYESQVDSVFGSHVEMLTRMRAFWDAQHGIPEWWYPDLLPRPS